jgi:MFS family permease
MPDDLLDKIGRNIKLNYIYTMLLSTQLDKGIWMLFLGYRGLGLVEIGLVESVYQLSQLLFGIPAGAIGDILGRRTSIILSVVTKAISYVLILTAGDFLGYAASFAFGAASLVFYNSASESITYESCLITGKSANYKQIYGNILALSFICTALGIAVGGFIANNRFEYVYYASLVILAVAMIPALFFVETRGIAVKGPPEKKPGLARVFMASVKTVLDKPLVLYLLVLYTSITLVDLTIYMYCQKYFQGMGVPIYFIGIILAVDSVFAAFGAKFASVLSRFPTKDVLVVIPLMIFSAYVMLSSLDAVFAIPFLFLATIFVVAYWPILSELINSRIPSDNRATVLSFKSQLSGAAIMVVFPVVGFFAERSSLSTAFLWLLTFMAPLVIFTVVKIRRAAF